MTYHYSTSGGSTGGIAGVSASSTGPVIVVAPPPLPQTIPDGADPTSWARGCVAHNYHQPVPRYLELHHVIPRAWQGAWQPAGVQIPRTGTWHPETVPLCRTGHGSVHYWIERMMHAIDAGATSPTEAARAALDGQKNVGRAEHIVARRALEEWVAAGGSLEYLASRGLWGGLYGGNTDTETGGIA